ncbi:hypothetical protein I204_05224 [Kwoniella mangroviensis CBS 8886]|uniref:uncharacterized protein n=1 Tax=Kwoniella mangroviensis CBS 8507 TaxID=1296122 RepID=UPI00080D8072|nr:uncharacterized protein I203_04577 [Kwoniella mangroviensis CBS 8507]OCF66250.1 hypothetical protein I203_04577 [Kwoniella mangroviensis CBS 8507]OCF73387.1 hypothetical protein I204_05224 [Kwoniella mangroviensis CBS 8886]
MSSSGSFTSTISSHPAGSIPVRGVGPFDESQKVTLLFYACATDGSRIELGRSGVISLKSQDEAESATQQQIGSFVYPSLNLCHRETWDPSVEVSKYSQQSARLFVDETASKYRIYHEVDASALCEASAAHTLSFFKPGDKVTDALYLRNEDALNSLSDEGKWLKAQYNSFRAKDDFHLEFTLNRGQFLEAPPPYPSEEAKDVPPEFDRARYRRNLEATWGDSTVGDFSKVQQPEDWTVLIPIIRHRSAHNATLPELLDDKLSDVDGQKD